jgi:hypothetical protein
MSKISSEFIVGSAIGYFCSNNLLVFTLGLATGVVIQEKFGSVYKFTQFCYDSSKLILKNQINKISSRWNANKIDNNLQNENISDINENTSLENANSLKNKED